MKNQLSSSMSVYSPDYSFKKNGKIVSKFGVNFLIKDNKVFLLRNYGPINYCTLIENDSYFFKKMLKFCKKYRYSSSQTPFIPTEEDWKIAKEETLTTILQITNKCNSNCNVCFVKESFPYSEMSILEIKEILSKIGKNKRILLFGGEPTVRKDIFKIIDVIKKSGNIPLIYTNGLKLADPKFVKKLKEHGIERVHLSFNGFREDVHKQLNGDSNQLFLKLKAIKNLENYDIKVYLSPVIACGINETEIEKILNLCIKNNHFIKGLYLFAATPISGRFEINIEKLLTGSDLINLLEKASDGVISKEYFLEFKRFRMNLYKILNKIGIFFPFGHIGSPTLFRIQNNKIQHFIPLKELKKINREMEKNNFIFILKNLFSNRFWLLLELLLNKFKIEAIESNILAINVANINNTYLNFSPVAYDSIHIAKIKDKVKFYMSAG